MMYVKAQSEHKYLLKLVLSGIHLKILGAYAIKYLVKNPYLHLVPMFVMQVI